MIIQILALAFFYLQCMMNMEDHNLNTVLKLKLKPLHYANEIKIANNLQHMS